MYRNVYREMASHTSAPGPVSLPTLHVVFLVCLAKQLAGCNSELHHLLFTKESHIVRDVHSHRQLEEWRINTKICIMYMHA